MDRRALFFVGAAAACLLLVPVAPADSRWIALTLGVTYIVLSVLSALDFAFRHRARRR